ncbi:Ig-like domain-containing protein [Curtobacterium sp. RRHDQ10]|uniref:Ig-like domain-containing protein n=1 Tax=Curtobacterium phyllosphaerae TaxID=3413379 RepID=UPI003BEF4DE7
MHALTGWRSLATRRLVVAIAFALVVLLGATFAIQFVATSTARAASALLCDQNTLYGVDSGGNLESIDATNGTVVKVGSMSPATNGLGISADGGFAYGFQNGSNQIAVYNATTGTSSTVTGADPAGNQSVIRGAVNPVNGFYYYASTYTNTGTTSTVRLGAYDPATGTKYGQVGTITGLPTGSNTTANGDLAFSTSGTMFVAFGNQVRRVDDVPASSGTTSLPSTLVASLSPDASGTAVNSPGIAFTTDGYLYVTNRATAPVSIIKINPSTGAQVATTALSDTAYAPLDLATCNYPDTAAAQVDVAQRWSTTDQFQVSLASTAPDTTQNASNTTTGNTAGLQRERAGSLLALPGRQYAITQGAGNSTTKLNHYSTTWSCTNANDKDKAVIASGTGNSGAFTFPSTATGQNAGTDVVCTFSNALVAVHSGAKDDTGTTAANTELDVAAPGVLANDQGTELTAALKTPPTNGTVTLNSDGSYAYVPNKDFSGTDSFVYTATDSSDQPSQSTTATVTITVTPTTTDDTGTTPANTTLTQTTSVLANDHGSNTTATLGQQAGHGSVTLATDGTYTYVPETGYSGPDSFTYVAKDGSGQTATGQVDLHVTPTAAADVAKTTPGQSITVPAAGVLANDTGTGLTAAVTAGPSHGTLTLDPNGGYTYTPTAGFAGKDSFTYTATDSSGQSTTPTTVTITVGVIAQPDTADALAGTTTTVDRDHGVLANDQGQGLTATVPQKPGHGTLDLAPDGSYTYTPTDPQYSGPDSFTYTATDSTGQTDTATVTITVLPNAVGDTATVADGSKATGNVLGNDHGTGILVTPPQGSTNGATTGPSHGTLVLQGNGSYTYTPDDGYSGPDQFTYTITDTPGHTATATVTIAVTPAAGDDTIMTAVGTAGSTNLLANDHGSSLTVTDHTVPGHGTLTIAADGTATFTPDAGYSGKTSFTYTVQDTTGQTATATVRIVVGVVANPDSGTTPANTPLTVDATHGVLANDQGSTLTAAVVTGPEHGNVRLAGDGSYVYTPIDGWSGPDSFTYSATDPDGVTATATVSLSVTPTAKSPSISVADGSSRSGNLLDGSAGDGLTTKVATAPAHGTLQLGTDGTYTYTPTDGYSGPDTATVTVTDRTGQTTTITVSATVTPAAAPHAYATMSGTVLTVPAPGLLTDAHGDTVAVSGLTKPGHGTVSTAPDGSFTYTPVDGFSGTDTFDYRVTDRTGQQTTATVTITVGIVTTPDTLTATTDTTSVVPAAHGVLANDRGTGLTATVATGPTHGDLALAKDGSYTYTPAAGYSGPDSFTYRATDGTATKTETVTITVLPKAVDDVATVVTGHTLDIDAPAVLGNDDGVGITVTSVSKPANGDATIAPDGTLQYTPVAGFSGIDPFTYTITDSSGGTATATVTITVTPRAVHDEVTVPAGSVLTTTAASGVLRNDLGSGLSVTGHTAPTDGTLSIQPDGSYTYTPNDGFSGTDTFTYTITDVAGHTSTTTVIVVVGTAATPDSATTTANTPLIVGPADSVLRNDEGTALTATADLLPTHGTLVMNGDGSYRYTPADGFSGHDRFTYTATDPNGNTSTGIVTITVLPKAVDDRIGTSAGKPVTVAAPGPLANDIGRTLKVSLVGTPAHGTATITANGALVYTPAKGYSGNDQFTYQVIDITGGTATATVYVGVTPVATNDTYTAIGGQSLSVPVGRGVTGDDDGTDLRVTLKTQAKHGIVTLSADGSFTYVPEKGYSGPDSFEYTATDADGQTTTATVNLVVAAAATAADDSVDGVFGQPATIDVLANDVPTQQSLFLPGSIVLVDPNGGGIATSVTVPGQGTWTVVDGKVRFVPVTGFTGAASIDYRVTDGAGMTVSATITVTYPTAAAHVGGVLAFTGGVSLLWLAFVALGVIGLGVVLRRRRNDGEPEPGPRRS